MNIKGLYNVKHEGLKKIFSNYPNIPAVKRHIKNPDLKMQYATGQYINIETGVPINEILEIPGR